MTKIQLVHTYEHITSFDNLLEAWQEFIQGKHNRQDVLEFGQNLSTNLISLYYDLLNKTYKHSTYQQFNISDPKPRIIHKASVRDRLVHHAVYRVLYPIFDTSFIFDSYSCRLNKGTHRAVYRLGDYIRKVSQNYS